MTKASNKLTLICNHIQSWEDATQASLQFILNSHQKKDPLSSKSVNEPVNLANLKRVILAVIESLKSSSIASENSESEGKFAVILYCLFQAAMADDYGLFESGRKPISPIHESDEVEEENAVPAGSRLGGNRVTSASLLHRSRLHPAQVKASAGKSSKTVMSCKS